MSEVRILPRAPILFLWHNRSMEQSPVGETNQEQPKQPRLLGDILNVEVEKLETDVFSEEQDTREHILDSQDPRLLDEPAVKHNLPRYEDQLTEEDLLTGLE